MAKRITKGKIATLKNNKNIVTIRRKKIDSNKIQGVILAYSSDLLLIQYIYDFNLDGLMVLRLSDVTSLKSSKTDIFQTQMLKDEGLYEKIKFSLDADVTNWKTCLQTIGMQYELVILENEVSVDSWFVLGKVNAINNETVSFVSFDGVAEWSDDCSELLYEDITSMQLGNNYSTQYLNYFNRNDKKQLH